MRELDYCFVDGNATKDEVLIKAGVSRAAGLLAAADSDIAHTYIVLSARALNPAIHMIARAGEGATGAKMLHAGADRMISPYAIAGLHMAVAAIQPAMVDFMTTGIRSGEGELLLAELHVTERSGLAGRSVGDVFGNRPAMTVLVLRRDDGELLPAPPRTEALRLHDQIIVMGPPQEMESFATRTGATVPVRHTERDAQP